jgi:carbonic anhydrase
MIHRSDCNCPELDPSRRRLFRTALCAAAFGGLSLRGLIHSGEVSAAEPSPVKRQSTTPDEALNEMLVGNGRFRRGPLRTHDYLQQKRSTVGAQHPMAIVLSCIDSRAPAEIVFDAGIGDLFNARLAGNVINNDVLGSMEFACQISKAKLIMVMGHTSCGAIKGAIDGAKLGHLTALVEKIKPAMEATH